MAPNGSKPSLREPLLELIFTKPRPDVAKAGAKVFAVVRANIDDDEPTVWLEDASRFAECSKWLRDVVQNHAHHCNVDALRRNWELFEGALTELDVAVTRQAFAGRAEHRVGVVDAPHALDERRYA